MFRYALLDVDREPVDPAVFVSSTPQWLVGDTLLITPGRRMRIVSIEYPLDLDPALNAVWTVEELPG